MYINKEQRWGGVGMMTFLALAHMVGATQHHVSCTCTWSVLRNIMFLALAHMVGATQHHVSNLNSSIFKH